VYKSRDWTFSLRRSPIGLALIAFLLSFSPAISSAETVDVPDQADCPGGNDGWQRHVETNVTTRVTVTHCVRVEVVNVPPVPEPTPIASPSATPAQTPTPESPPPVVQPAPVTVTRVVGLDPYPSLGTGDELPGTRLWSTNETTWNKFYENSIWTGWKCPSIYGPNGDPYAGENNGFDTVTGKFFRVCVKNPWREPLNPQVQAKYVKDKSDAQELARVQSEQWNSEHPGMQKCFPWGPLTSPSGGVESGGVCANPVGSATSSTQSGNSETSTVSSSDSSTVTTALLDPLPNLKDGEEIVGTRITGQGTITCPEGAGSAIEVNATTKVTSTYCIKNWKRTEIPQNESKPVIKSEINVVPSAVKVETTTVVSAIVETTTMSVKPSTEETITGSIDVKSINSKSTVVVIDIESSKTIVKLTATKKGFKTITQSVTTNSSGNKNVTFAKNLKGYTLTIMVDGQVIDRTKV
jgi:hypothetical protein